MFTPIEDLPGPLQFKVLTSLDASADWEATWDIGLTDPGDSFAVRPLWGRYTVDGRWPAAFALGHHGDPRPWRADSTLVSEYRASGPRAFSLDRDQKTFRTIVPGWK